MCSLPQVLTELSVGSLNDGILPLDERCGDDSLRAGAGPASSELLPPRLVAALGAVVLSNAC